MCHRLSRDQPQPGSFFQRPREAEKRDAGIEVGLDLVQMADNCDAYILTKNRLSEILSNEPPLKCLYSGGGGIYITSVFFLLAPFFIN